MRQWLNTNSGSLPASESEWNSWSLTDREWDTSNSDDMIALSDMLTLSAPDVSLDNAQLRLYLTTHDGKIGSVADLTKWATGAPDVTAVQNFVNGNGAALSGTNDRELLQMITSAQNLLDKRATYSDADWATALHDAGFDDDSQLRFYADLVDFGTSLSSDDVWTDVASSAGYTELPGEAWKLEIWKHEPGNVYNQIEKAETRSELSKLAGKTISLDGKRFLVHQDSPLAYGAWTTPTGTTMHQQGVLAYDPEGAEWVVLLPGGASQAYWRTVPYDRSESVNLDITDIPLTGSGT
jgi:hypothetical protein